eukprot:jgi/Mesvir1/5843/Mv00636-RA.1
MASIALMRSLLVCVLLAWACNSAVRASSCGPRTSVETPSCEVKERKEEYELRTYHAGEMWASTIVHDSTFDEARKIGFSRCFNYISGMNSKYEKIPMTAPVRISPVPRCSGWKVSFFVPARYHDLEDVPEPDDPKVKIEREECITRAVYGPFGGFPDLDGYERQKRNLLEALKQDGIKYDNATVVFAGYSSPFQILNRAQEVWVNVQEGDGEGTVADI